MEESDNVNYILTPQTSEVITNNKFICEKCDFICYKLSNWSTHITTRKHLNRTNLNNLEQQKCKVYSCKYCNKEYNARNSLWYHENKCTMSNIVKEEITDNKDNKDIFLDYLIKQNSELQKQILEMCKNNTNQIQIL